MTDATGDLVVDIVATVLVGAALFRHFVEDAWMTTAYTTDRDKMNYLYWVAGGVVVLVAVWR